MKGIKNFILAIFSMGVFTGLLWIALWFLTATGLININPFSWGQYPYIGVVLISSITLLIIDTKSSKISNSISQCDVNKEKELIEYENELYLSPLIQKYISFGHENANQNMKYTNSQFRKLNEKLVPLLEKMDKIVEIKKEVGNKMIERATYNGRVNLSFHGGTNILDFNTITALTNSQYPLGDSVYMISKNHKKGFDGEDFVKSKMLDQFIDFDESVNLKKDKFQVELDFLIITFNNKKV